MANGISPLTGMWRKIVAVQISWAKTRAGKGYKVCPGSNENKGREREIRNFLASIKEKKVLFLFSRFLLINFRSHVSPSGLLPV